MNSTFTDETSAVGTIREVLRENIGPQKFKVWFEHSTKFDLAGEYLKIDVPNLFIANWIEAHFADPIEKACCQATGSTRKLNFTINPQLSGHHRNAADARSGTESKKPEKKPSSRTKKPNAAKQRRLKLQLDTFVVGPSNELAYNAANTVINDQENSFNPLFIHGGYGVGKTHLLQGICNAVCANRPRTNWLYLSAEDFANQFVLALKTRKLEAFRRRMRQTDLLAIDDIHFLASKPSTQQEFLHTFNTIDLAGKQIVMVSDAHPKQIGQISEKLISRFVSGMVVKIDKPDYKTRYLICRQYAEKMDKNVPEAVLEYVAENVNSNVRELEGAMLKLFAFASLNKGKITISTASQALHEHLARTDPIVRVSDIESTVSDYFQITPADLHSSKKNKTIALARHFSMYLARKHTTMSSSEIGRFMGGKNHATVLMACKKIDQRLQKNSQVTWQSSAGNRIAKAKSVLENLEQTLKS